MDKLGLPRGGSRTAAKSRMERFVIIVNGWKPLTIITKRSVLDLAAALEPLLVHQRLTKITLNLNAMLQPWPIFGCFPFDSLPLARKLNIKTSVENEHRHIHLTSDKKQLLLSLDKRFYHIVMQGEYLENIIHIYID